MKTQTAQRLEANVGRWIVTFGVAGVLALLALLALGGATFAVAQDSTPAADAPITVAELAPGITAEVFSGVPSARAPGQTLYLARFVFDAGAELYAHSHPGTTSVGIAEGSLGWTLVAGTAYVIRGAAAGATGPIENLTEPGTDIILEPGDAIYYEDDVVHTARGAGDTPAVVMGTLLLTTGAPLLMPAEDMTGMEMGGTPET